MASCVRNIHTKNYKNQIIFVQVRIENVRDVFLRHSVVTCMEPDVAEVPLRHAAGVRLETVV